MNNELWFDGSCEPTNPGGTGRYGYVINIGTQTVTGHGNLGKHDWMTNNIAEWTALVEGLKKCVELGIKELCVYGDSNIVINGASGQWRVKAEHLKPYKVEAERLKLEFDNISFTWVCREMNTIADELSKYET